MLHRPDYLADLHAIAGAFAQLQDAGKVRYFGVSNFRPDAGQRAASRLPDAAHRAPGRNQPWQIGRLRGRHVGSMSGEANHAAGVESAGRRTFGDGAKRLLPAQKSYRTKATVKVLDEIAKARGVSRTVVAMAWLLKHPSRIMPIVGSNNPDRIREAAKAPDVD